MAVLVACLIVALLVAAAVWIAARRDRRVAAMPDEDPLPAAAWPITAGDDGAEPYLRGAAPAAAGLSGRR